MRAGSSSRSGTMPPGFPLRRPHVRISPPRASRRRAAQCPRFAREIGTGISAAFVLLAMMLPLGFIAFAPMGTYAVEAGLSAALAAAIFGNLTAFVLSGALLRTKCRAPRRCSCFPHSSCDSGRTTPSSRTSSSSPHSAWSSPESSGSSRPAALRQHARPFVPYPVVAGLMTGLAISLIWYEIPEVLGTHGNAPHSPWNL